MSPDIELSPAPPAAGVKARPNVLLLLPYYRPAYYGGAIQVYHQLAARVRAAKITVLSQRQCVDPFEREEFDRTCAGMYGYDIRRIRRFDLIFSPEASIVGRMVDCARFFFGTRAEWRKAVRELQPDVIVCGATITAGWLMSHTPGTIPFVNYIHGEEFGNNATSRFLRPYMFRQQLKAIRRAQLNITVSHYTAQKAAELAGVDVADMAVLPNFVDLDRFFPPPRRNEVRKKLGWNGKRIILSLARLIKRKGFDQAVRAIADLRRRGQLSEDWIHVIAGRGDEETALRSLVSELGMDDYTRFAGFVPDEQLAEYYGAADVFLHPNRDIAGDTEGFGIVFLEASACGTPVIGGVAGGTADAIQDGVTGFRVDSEDVPAISRAIAMLTGNEDLRGRMIRSGLELVRREHRIEHAVEKFEGYLEQAADSTHDARR
jgi:phosphatidyl-myo-inositol dimannoside synthase